MAKSKKSSKSNGASTAFTAQVQKAMTALASLEAAIDALDLPALTEEERQTASGRLRVGEAAAMTAIFDAMDAYPGVFAPLAAKDYGTDPTAVETAPSRAALAESQALVPIQEGLAAVLRSVGDGIIGLATQAKDVSVPAYAIGKAGGNSDPALKKEMAPALSFYGKAAATKKTQKKRAATKASKAAKAAKSAPTSPS